MPRLRVRFTVRRVMVAVAIVALALGLWGWAARLRVRAARYRELAIGYEIGESYYNSPAIGPPDPVDRAVVVGRFAALRRKYDYAARHPWLPVDRDPPEPIEATRWGITITIDPDEQKKARPIGVGPLFHPPRF